MALTAERLRSLLHYDPATGVFTWLVSRGRNAKAGDEAGTIDRYGYRCITIDGRPYKGGRLAHLYMTGRWPARYIDHRDRVRSNDRWENLREATPAENMQNREARRSSRSGLLGVSWIKAKNRWKASICVGGKSLVLGSGFTTADEAHAAYLAAKREFHSFGG